MQMVCRWVKLAPIDGVPRSPNCRQGVGMARTSDASGPRRLAVYNDVVTLDDLCTGRTRMALIRDMALGELSDRELALRIACDLPTIKAFRALYADEITEVRGALAGQLAIETAGLWIAKRQNRVAEYQSDVEQINAAMRDLITDAEGNVVPMLMATREFDRLLRAKHFAMQAVNSEYGLAEKRGQDNEAPIARYILELPDNIREALS